MTEPNLDKILRRIAYWNGYDSAGEWERTGHEVKAQLEQYIANQVREARKDELAKLIFNDDEFATLEEIKNGKSVGGGMIQTELVEDRIKELGE